MISIREQNYGLNVALYNEFTLDDFRELEQAVIAASARVHRPDMLLDLSLLKDFTIDMAWEQLKFVREHDRDFGRIAVIVDDIWIKSAALISELITQTHPTYFTDAAQAQAWLLEEAAE